MADLASCDLFPDDGIVVDMHLKEVPSELSASADSQFDALDRRFDAVERRFDKVDAAIVELRQYTEFAVGKLQQELVVVKSGLGRVERKLDRLIDGTVQSEKPDPE